VDNWRHQQWQAIEQAAEASRYKAIFRVGDQRVGQWSDEVSITVGG